ncbi:oligosaccharide repeat unit polymerase [Aeromonas veronii]
MYDKLRSPKFVFFIFFILVNIFSYVLVTNSGSLIGESSAIEFTSWYFVVPVLIMLVISYFFILCPVYIIFRKVYVRSIFPHGIPNDISKFIGIIVLSLQLSFILYFSLTGTFSANSTERAGSIGSAFWVFISIDNLFLVYYALFRETNLFKYNLFFAVASNVLRGWSSIFFIIIFLEFSRLYRLKRLKMYILLLSSVLVIVLYPFIYFGKLILRAMTISGGDLSVGVDLVFTGLEKSADSVSFVTALSVSLEQVITRFQLLSNALAVYEVREYLNDKLVAGDIVPYWAESIYGIIFHKMLNLSYGINLGEMMANIISSSPFDTSWNSNPSFLAWFFIEPSSSICYILFVLTLCAVSMFICKLSSGTGLYLDLIWFSWLIYVLPGWNASLVLFVHAQIIFLFMIMIVFLLSRISLLKIARGCGDGV